LNIFLARKIVIILLISGTLITSIAATTQTFATTKQKPDIGIDDGLTTEGGAEAEEATDEDDNETTSAIVAPQDRYCMEGTGGNTGKACIRCDPGLNFEVGCIDVTTGGPLLPPRATSESGENKGKGEFMTPEIAKMLQGTNPDDRPKIIFGNLVEQLSSGDTEESTKALDTLCIMASADNSSKVDCSKPVECGPLCGALVGWLAGKVLDKIVSTQNEGPTGCYTYVPPIYCKLQK